MPGRGWGFPPVPCTRTIVYGRPRDRRPPGSRLRVLLQDFLRPVKRVQITASRHQLAMPLGRRQPARAFYAGVLGLAEVDKPPALAARGGAWFRAGGVELHLGVEEDFRPTRKGHPGILVGDLDELVRRLAASGQAVTWDEDFPGFSRVYAHDPFGNRLEFLRPASR